MKSIFSMLLCICSLATSQATADNLISGTEKIATVVLSKNLKHGDVINVRQSLDDLHANDLVLEVQVTGSALTSGSYLQLIADQTVVQEGALEARLNTVRLPLNMRNGVDYKRLTLRAIGQIKVTQLTAVIESGIGDLPVLPPEPIVRPPVIVAPPIGLFMTCSTFSNSYRFSDSGRDSRLVRNNAISQCSSNPNTSNQECSANISCDNEPQRHLVRCNTFSRGYNFSREGLNSQVTRQLMTAQCTANPNTSNADCASNVRCSDDRFEKPVLTCGTFSNGYNFNYQGVDEGLTRQAAVAQCTSNPNTSNAECTTNISCDNRPAPPVVTCSTMSRGYNFSDAGRDLSVLRQSVIQQCTSNPNTSNADCAANFYCGGAFIPPMIGVPPIDHGHLTPDRVQNDDRRHHGRPPRFEPPGENEERDQNGNLIPGRR